MAKRPVPVKNLCDQNCINCHGGNSSCVCTTEGQCVLCHGDVDKSRDEGTFVKEDAAIQVCVFKVAEVVSMLRIYKLQAGIDDPLRVATLRRAIAGLEAIVSLERSVSAQGPARG